MVILGKSKGVFTMCIKIGLLYISLDNFPAVFDSLVISIPFFFLSFVFLYLLCSPIVKFLIKMNNTLLLSYLITSFVFFLALFILSYLLSITQIPHHIYQTIFICLLIFGVLLIIRRIYMQIVKR